MSRAGLFLGLTIFLSVFLSPSLCAETIRMGVLPVIDTLPLQVAKKEGFFKEEELEVELIRFSSAMERNIAMQSGRLDGFFGDIPATLLLVKSGIPVKFLTVSYFTTPGQRMFVLVLSSQNRNRNSGRIDVAISKGSIIEYLLDRLKPRPPMDGFQIVPKEIKQMPVRMQMLAAGKIDAALLPEPLATLAESKGAKSIVTDEHLNIPLTVLNLHRSKLPYGQPFLKAYAKAVASLNANAGNYLELMVETCRVPEFLAAKFIAYTFPKPRLPSEEEVESVQKWMQRQGLLDRRISYQKLIR